MGPLPEVDSLELLESDVRVLAVGVRRESAQGSEKAKIADSHPPFGGGPVLLKLSLPVSSSDRWQYTADDIPFGDGKA